MRLFHKSCLAAAMAAAVVSVLIMTIGTASAQSGGNSGSINGIVQDPSGAVVPNATVEIHQAVSGYDQTTTTDSKGNFSFPNVPFNPYHMTVTAAGFAQHAQDVEVRSVVPARMSRSVLTVAGSSDTVTVEAGADLLENDPTFHTDVDKNLFDKLPLESASSSLSSLVTLTTPGIAADSNGLFHGLGDHAENSFSVDGQPITDQQSKVFSNQIPLESVQSMEVISGAPPAEYGGKTSVVIVATTRSGQGVTTPHGSVTTSYGAFGTSNVASRSRLRRSKVGKLYLGRRPEQRPVPRSAGIRRDARQGQRRESLRPGGLSILDRGFAALEFGIHPLLVPDAKFLRLAIGDAVEWSGGRQRRPRSRWQRRRPGRPAFPDQDLQHRAYLDSIAQSHHRVHFGRFCPARRDTTTIPAPIHSRTSGRPVCRAKP